MARIAGIDLPNKKRVEIALTYIYGIGRPTANEILEKAEIDKDTKVQGLSDEEVNKIRILIENEYRVEGDLRREFSLNVKRLMDLGNYRGLRHRRWVNGWDRGRSARNGRRPGPDACAQYGCRRRRPDRPELCANARLRDSPEAGRRRPA